MHTRFKKGEVHNPHGRTTAGATVKDRINVLARKNLPESRLRRLATDTKAGWVDRVAAEWCLWALQFGDMADLEPWLNGKMTLDALRKSGFDTRLIKKARVKDDGAREVELHDRAGDAFEKIMDRTEGKPAQAVAVDHTSGGEPVTFTLNIGNGIDNQPSDQ